MRLYSIMKDFLTMKEYLPMEYFMKRYDVSRRTIQNDLSYLIQISSRNGYQLHMRRGNGYLLEVVNERLLDEFMKSLEHETMFDMKDRVKNMMAYLTLQESYVSMDRMAEQFQISRTSVKKDLQEVENQLQVHHLQLEKKSHYGIRIRGDTQHIRKLMSELYFDGNTFITQELEKEEASFSRIHEVLVHSIEREHLNINYNELKNVIVWLKVTLYLAQIQAEERYHPTARKDACERVGAEVIQTVEGLFTYGISKKTYQQFLEVLRINIRQMVPVSSFSVSLRADINQFLQECDEVYGTEFSEDEVFKTSLLTHVSLLIDRLHQKISYKNNLISEICIRYPMIFNIAIRFADMLKEKYDVEATHDEVGFVATHFAAHMEKERELRIRRFNRIGVVCSTGGGSAYLIKLQIESLFVKAEVETFSFLQLEELEAFQPDLIFTIVPLNREFSAPIIYIKELLDDQDLIRIRQVLQFDNCDSLSIADVDSYMYSLFSRDFFQISEETDYLRLLKQMADQLETCGYGGAHYADYVMERESYMSTVYAHGVAIPHPIQILAEKNMISVCILHKPILYEGKEVRIIFMISLTRSSYEMHKDITRKLYQLMKDEKRLEQVLSSRTLEELLIVMKELDGGSL